MKKEYVKPEMELIDLDCKINLLQESCDCEFSMTFPKDGTNVG